MPKNASLSITGFGIISSLGINTEETSRLFSDSAPTISLSEELPILAVPTRPEWREQFGDLETGLKVNLLAQAAVAEALNMARIAPRDFQNLRIGVCLGSTVGCSNFQPQFSIPFHTGKLPDPTPLFSFFKNNTAQLVSRALGCKGPTMLVSNACTSGADAIGLAAQWLQSDLCDLVICGGAEEILPQIYHGFRSMMLCSPQICTPFDKNRQGLTLGEGAGILILEKPSTPRKSLAKFLGYGSHSDAYHPTAPNPKGEWLDHAIQKSFAQAGIESVDFINVHGTATEHNDSAEGAWIREHAAHTPVVATKGYTGHTLAAAGAIEAVLTILSLQKQILPASKGFKEMDPKIGITPTTSLVSGSYKTALSLSLGFGGTNAALCLGRA